MMNVLSKIRQNIEKYGYIKITDHMEFGVKQIWYQNERSVDGLKDVIVLDYKSKYKGYGIRSGIFHSENSILCRRLIERLRYLFHPAFEASLRELLERPCWSLFDPGRKLGWNLLTIPDPMNRDIYEAQLEELIKKFLERYIWPVNSAPALLDFLLGNDVPFDWGYGFPLLRAVEVLGLVPYSGVPSEVVAVRLLAHRTEIQRDLVPGEDCEAFIEKCIRFIEDEK